MADFETEVADIDVTDGVAATSDKERIAESAPLAPELSPERPKTTQEKRQETTRLLFDHFDDQWFVYGSHSGTLADMISLCPSVNFIIDMGFEGAVSFFDGCRATKELIPESLEVEEEGGVKNSEDHLGEDNQLNKAESETQEGEGVNSISEKTKPEALSSHTTSDEDTTQELPKVEDAKKVESPPILVKSSSTEKSGNTEKKSIEVSKKVDKIVEDSPVEVAEVINEEVIFSDTIEQYPEITQEGVSSEVDVDAFETPMYPEDLTEITVAAPDDDMKIESELEVSEVLTEEMVEQEPEVVRESLEEHADLTEVIEHESESVQTQEVEADSVLELFDGWAELAKEEVPLEDFLQTVVEELEEVDIANQLEVEPIAIQEMIEHILEHPEVGIEEMLLDEARPELYAACRSLRSLREPMEYLRASKSPEEYAHHLEIVIDEVCAIIAALGYANPEEIVRNFLSTHSPESLARIIEVLEETLRSAMYEELAARRMKSAHHNSLRLGKFIGFVLGLLVPNRAINNA